MTHQRKLIRRPTKLRPGPEHRKEKLNPSPKNHHQQVTKTKPMLTYVETYSREKKKKHYSLIFCMKHHKSMALPSMAAFKMAAPKEHDPELHGDASTCASVRRKLRNDLKGKWQNNKTQRDHQKIPYDDTIIAAIYKHSPSFP